MNQKFMLGLVVGFSLPIACAYVFLVSGGMPVATNGSPLPMERFVAKTALRAAMRGQTQQASPIIVNEQILLRAAKTYNVHCAVCHGLYGGERSAIAGGLFPKPPRLLGGGHGVTDDPIGKIYWKVKNGIRLTGMPGFVDHLSDTELWEVSELLLNADKLPASVHGQLEGK